MMGKHDAISAKGQFGGRGFEDRVCRVDYYLLASGRDEDRALPIRVSKNRAGDVIAVETPDAAGKPVITNDMWTDAKDSPWIRRTDREGYEAALEKIRIEAVTKIVRLPRPSA
jgi:hypothetical protein